MLLNKILAHMPFAGLRNETPLAAIIRQAIRADGPISLERYMQLALHHPEHGYYRQGNPLGEGGDFGTFPEISQLFNEMVAAWCVKAWTRLGSPPSFVLLELGPGRGTLMHYLLRFTAAVPEFQAALRLHLVESNATLRDAQQERLSAYNPAFLQADDIPALPQLPLIAIANELFDTLPMRQFVKARDGWRERMVGLRGNRLIFTLSGLLPDAPPLFDAARLTEWPDGAIYEISPQAHAITAALAAHMRAHGGAGLFLDYGYEVPPVKGTLDAWSRHKYVDTFAAPGHVDVTAGVDFVSLCRTAQQNGAMTDGPLWQGMFLTKMGLKERATALKNAAPRDALRAIDLEVRQLTDARGLGSDFYAMMLRSWND